MSAFSSDDRNEKLELDSTKMLELFPLAYVRPVTTEKGIGYGVYAADGTQLAVFATKDAAYFSAKQHDLEPALIH